MPSPRSNRQIVQEALESAGVHFDTLSYKLGVWKFRRGFYYTHGQDSDKLAAKIFEALKQFDCHIIERHEIWKPFRGGASIANQSHWLVVFTLDPMKIGGRS